MRSRIEILKELVLLQSNVEILKKELSHYTWDIEKPLFEVKKENIVNVLKRSIDNEIDFETLANWADTIEYRDDLDFTDEEIKEIIFELANPEINGEITKERLNKIISELEK